MARTIAKISEETLKVQSFIESQKDGAELSFEKIAYETGVKMDTRGRGYLRTAIKRTRKEYSSIPKYGIKLADKDSAMPILLNKLTKIDRAVKRGSKSRDNIQEHFYRELDETTQKELLYIGAVFGAIRIAADNGKIMYSKNKKMSDASLNIQIPKFD